MQSVAITAATGKKFCPLPCRLAGHVVRRVILLGLLMLASAICLALRRDEKIACDDFWFTFWLLLRMFCLPWRLLALWRYDRWHAGLESRLVSAMRCHFLAQVSVAFPCRHDFAVGVRVGYLWAMIEEKNAAWHDLARHAPYQVDQDRTPHEAVTAMIVRMTEAQGRT